MLILMDYALFKDRMLDDLDGLMIDRSKAEPLEINAPAARIIAMDGMRHFIEIEPHEHRSEPQAMVSMEMTDENARDMGRRYIGVDELALRSLAGIEEQTLF